MRKAFSLKRRIRSILFKIADETKDDKVWPELADDPDEDGMYDGV
jgi:hypothetical protein